MSRGNYHDYILSADQKIVRDVQDLCAMLAERGGWTAEDAVEVAEILNASPAPRSLFRFMDEKTGSMYVGYRTRDGREWFHVLRQMRNARGSGLLENLAADGERAL